MPASISYEKRPDSLQNEALDIKGAARIVADREMFSRTMLRVYFFAYRDASSRNDLNSMAYAEGLLVGMWKMYKILLYEMNPSEHAQLNSMTDEEEFEIIWNMGGCVPHA